MGVFDWTILETIFATFYDFFVRIATALTFTPEQILGEWANGDLVWSWSFFNPFTGFTTSTTISHSIIGEAVMNLLSSFGYGYMPLWQAFLLLTSTFFFVIILGRVISNIFG